MTFCYICCVRLIINKITHSSIFLDSVPWMNEGMVNNDELFISSILRYFCASNILSDKIVYYF